MKAALDPLPFLYNFTRMSFRFRRSIRIAPGRGSIDALSDRTAALCKPRLT